MHRAVTIISPPNCLTYLSATLYSRRRKECFDLLMERITAHASDAVLHPERCAAHNGLIEQLTAQTKPQGAGRMYRVGS
jgi:hypothetical protein